MENYSFPFKNFASTSHSPEWLWRILLRIRHDISNSIAIRKIEKALDFSKIDVIHSNLNRIDIGVILAKRHNKPHIWHIREHGKKDFNIISVYNKPCNYMNKFQSSYVTISKSVYDEWVKNGLDKRNMQVIYDGIRTETICPVVHQNDKIQVLFLGGYDETKGQHQLIEAVLDLSIELQNKIHVTFLGNGNLEYKEKLIELTKDKQDLFEFNGYSENIYKILPKYDIGVNCSKAEGFGRVTVEYMLAGLCPIVSDQGANPEIVHNGEQGVVYEYGKIESLKEKLELLINNSDLIRNYGVYGRNSIIENFSMKKHADLILKLYREVLGEKD